MKCMAAFHPSNLLSAHSFGGRSGPFNPDGTTASTSTSGGVTSTTQSPKTAFGFESQPGHGASSNRGECSEGATISAVMIGLVDSVGGTSYGGTGVYRRRSRRVDLWLGEAQHCPASSDLAAAQLRPGHRRRRTILSPRISTQLTIGTQRRGQIRPQGHR